MNIQYRVISGAFGLAIAIGISAGPAFADNSTCSGLPSYANLQAALENAVGQSNGGLGFNMWQV
jgi:hypothetical protein